MKIGITGASGHIGANLVRVLDQTDHDIRVLQFNGDHGFNGFDLEITKGNLRNATSLIPFCEGLDVVIHLAALISIGNYSYEELYETNVNGTKALIHACKNAGVKKFIHFSSIHALVHEPFDITMDESRALALESPINYERSKAIAEEWVLTQQSKSLDVVVINPTAVLGPNDFMPSLMGQFIVRLLKNKIPGLLSGGYDWVDVRDIVAATINAIEMGRGGERYILSGEWKSLVDFSGILGELSGKSLRKLIFPLWFARMGLPFMHFRAKYLHRHPLYTNESLYILQSGNRKISNEKARRELGFTPRPLRETLRDSLQWYTEKNYL